MVTSDILKLVIVLSFSSFLISSLIFRKTKQAKSNRFKSIWKSRINLLSKYSMYITLAILITSAVAYTLKYILRFI